MSRGGTARNILQSECFEILKKSGNKIVIISPAHRDKQFTDEFSGENILFEEMIEPTWRWSDRLMVGIHKALVYNKSTIFRDLYGIYNPEEGSKLKFWMRKIFISPLAKIKTIKKAARAIDTYIARAEHYHDLFEKYEPDLLFSTSMIEDNDVAIMKQARDHDVPIIAMPKTWDNPSKINLRVQPDTVIVWGEFSSDEVQTYSAVSKNDILICGIPQFDVYKDESVIMSRERFCDQFGFDPDKKIIVFGSEGRVTPQDKNIAEAIARWVEHDEITHAQLFVRPHFMYPEDRKKFEGIQDNTTVHVDNSWKISQGFRDNWDYSKKQIHHFANLMVHVDVMVTTASTLSIDAAATNTPVINIYFDTPKPKPFNMSVRRWYTTEHYTNVLKTGAVSLAHSLEELKEYINRDIKNPNIRERQRADLVKRFGYKTDGQSGKRIADAVLKQLSL